MTSTKICTPVDEFPKLLEKASHTFIWLDFERARYISLYGTCGSMCLGLGLSRCRAQGDWRCGEPSRRSLPNHSERVTLNPEKTTEGPCIVCLSERAVKLRQPLQGFERVALVSQTASFLSTQSLTLTPTGSSISPLALYTELSFSRAARGDSAFPVDRPSEICFSVSKCRRLCILLHLHTGQHS